MKTEKACKKNQVHYTKEKEREKLNNQKSSDRDHNKEESCMLLELERPNNNCKHEVKTSHV